MTAFLKISHQASGQAFALEYDDLRQCGNALAIIKEYGLEALWQLLPPIKTLEVEHDDA